ncbi:DUF6456 domain-containing protein [Halodurantibacterium flavum]|uniref:DUF6456 domain-containing protein n=1 Tax=Halodurantibacterium flavum TaxID=1382802 RepID=A0ABW4S4H0_9RHOB
MTAAQQDMTPLPAWLPDAVRIYLSHTERGVSLRALARAEGCHASTVLRQVRRFENRRDDPLVDEALARIGRAGLARSDKTVPVSTGSLSKDMTMTAPIRADALVSDEVTLAREARRVLRRLCEPGAVLVVAPGMEKAAVLRELPDGMTARVAVLDRHIAEAFALKDWITCRRSGRVARYEATAAGRAAVRRFLAEDEAQAARGMAGGIAEAAMPFAAQHRIWGEKLVEEGPHQPARKMRYNVAESPVAALARRRDKDGTPFLSADLVAAGERLREDFELAQMGPRVAQNWDRFLTGGARGAFQPGAGPADGPRGARDRVAAALRDLGPGLGDMVLRCCCYLEGLEQAEQRLGWSARSGKIVLRIALQRLRLHYDEVAGPEPLIG